MPWKSGRLSDGVSVPSTSPSTRSWICRFSAKALTFAPADRIAYNLSKTWTLAIEHYADYGRFANFEPLGQQYHALFGVIDYNADPFSDEFGVGHGFTTASEPLILKLMLVRTF